MNLKHFQQSAFQTVRNLTFIGITVLLAACSGGGADLVENDDTTPPVDNGYQGPPPENDEVSRFKQHIWDNLSATNRCGQCHTQDGGQTPMFVRTDDVNLAYQEAASLINLNEPEESRLVTKVAGGHNCWESSAQACADNITRWIQNWANDSGVGQPNSIVLTPPEDQDPGATRSFPESSDLFASTVYPLLTTYCADCHTDTAANAQSPFFARDDVDAAYDAVKSKIDINSPERSRLVLRLREEFHNCWDDCVANANEMQSAIEAFRDQIPIAEVDPEWVLSRALSLTNGIVASSGGRHEANAIAIWEFKTGEGATAFDTSGVEPALHLTLSGDTSWVGGWGVRITDGRMQGTTQASQKIHDYVSATGEFSVEAWVVPGNVTQEGPARIISYSGANDQTNFVVGQTLYNYDFLIRSSETGADGMPALSTPDNDEVLQASLQHVVVNYKFNEGRSIYVNGELVSESDEVPGGNLNDWDPSFALVMGNEVSGDRLWQGVVRFAAIHSRMLTEEQIQKNFDAGVGEKFYLLFNVSEHTGVEMGYVLFEVSQFDSYSYLFSQPHFVSLTENAVIDNVPMRNMRIGINGKEAVVGQAYSRLDTTLTTELQIPPLGQRLSEIGTIIALENGPAEDQFFLTFEQLGNATNVRVEAALPPVAQPVDGEPQPEIGLRTFDEIYYSFSEITGIPVNNADVQATYNQVRQALPISENIRGFLSSQQMGITQLAIEYCNALVEDSTRANAFFGSFNFDGTPASSLDTAGRNQILTALRENISGVGLASQPMDADFDTELNNLIDRLATCGSNCDADRTRTIVKSVCAAGLGSAIVLIQ